jgi:peptidoglycan/LPS O-acetylase OafA/YrhL
MSASLSYRPDIDGLRAVSVTVVMLFHLGMTTMSGGFVGVDVFFVISGYLITSIIAREVDAGEFTFAGFYERRIRRIYPALIVMLAATFLGAWIALMPREFLAFARTLIATPLFAANFMFLGEDGYFDAASLTKPLLHTWSLGVEEQFYIVFPWLLIAARRYGWNRLAIVVAVVVASLASSVVAGALDWGQAYFLLPMWFWELGFGALLALHRTTVPPRLRDVVGVGGLAMIVASCFLIDESMAFPGWVALLPVVGASGVMVAAGSPANRLLATRPFVFIGRISYPMYLWHWPLIVFAVQVLGRPLQPLEAAGIFALTVLLSWGTLVLIEAPIRARRRLASRSRLFVVASALSLVLVGAGIAGFAGRGLPGRLSPEVRAIADVAADPPAIDKACRRSRTAIARNLPPCEIGASEPKHYGFAVIGDSHSRALAAAIGDVAKREGAKGLYLGRVACPPLLGLERHGAGNWHCADHLDWAMRRIAEENIGTVLVVARWGVMLPPASYGNEHVADLRYARDGREVARDRLAAEVEAGLRATLDALKGRRVVVLFSVPEIGFDVPTVLAAAKRFGWTPPETPDRGAYEARQKKIRDLFAAAGVARPGVEILEPADLLCGAGRCRIVEDGRILYSDDDHLSATGAAAVAPLFAPALKRAAAETR